MSGVTHGLGVFFSIAAGLALSNKVKDKSQIHVISCMVYSISLVVLYTASTLYHSFFTMKHTKYLFEVIDKCAIYILIAGSYTPFLQIVLRDYPMWSIGLLIFIWTACFFGVLVEAMCPTWKYKGRFSLTMYLSMGWCCMICMRDLLRILPQGAVNLIVLGGVGYTSGVPFFVRNNNLDHSIWHLFVLAGSVIHWIGIYIYVADM
jgi:hemolysin III